MHIIWKRPDGFQNAVPEDFRRVPLSNGAQLWLHRHELDWYPFQVSGDWAGQDQTKKLNRLVNLLDSSDEVWRNCLDHFNDNELLPNKDLGQVGKILQKWLDEIKVTVKGNTWEVEIMLCAFSDLQQRLISLDTKKANGKKNKI